MANGDITPDRARELLAYDKDSGALTWRVAVGRRMRAGSVAGSVDPSNRYVRVAYGGRKYAAHRIAWLVATGEWPNGEIDHINGNKTDNRWCNLRLCQHAENTRNRAVNSLSRTGVKGVTLTRSGTFEADITLDGRRIHLGTFRTKSEAAEVRRLAALAMHGEFASEAR